MRRLRKLLRLTPADRWLLLRAALAVGAIRLGLSVLPFRTVRRLLARGARARTPSEAAERTSAERVVWAVTVASRHVARATCLTQALAVELLLRRQGYPAHLRIGVGRAGDTGIEAHAWVESQGRIVIGGSGQGRYTPLPALDSEAGKH
jgi:transglutaminase superfamily protein